MELSPEISEIDQLRSELREYDRAYYEMNKSLITDREYDFKMKRLIELENKHPEKYDSSSPSLRVGNDLLDHFDKVRHEKSMLSISNVYNVDELKEYIEKTRKIACFQDLVFCCELKIDGLSLSLTYNDGKLVRALTRGDGEFGEDVTENAKMIFDIPLEIEEKQEVNVRGEVYIDFKTFEYLNERQVSLNKQPYANPRNLASGSLKLLLPNDVKKRNLKFLAYYYSLAKTQDETFDLLIKNKFSVCEDKIVFTPIFDEIVQYINRVEQEKESYKFPIDGVVIKVNDFKHHDVLGVTSKSPRYMIAYKLYSEKVWTKLESVDYQVGRTGKITPVANLTPVTINGTVVKRATLHNISEMKKLGIKINDTVEIEKAGEIIPQVLKYIESERTSDCYDIPEITNCPVCGSVVVFDDVSAFCVNVSCTAVKKRVICHFVSKDAMDIDGVGESLVEQLVDFGKINDFADLYKLTEDDIVNLPRQGSKSAQNAISSINDSRHNNLDKLIVGLCIPGCGRTLSKQLCKYYKSIDELIDCDREFLKSLDMVGDIIANAIVEYFKDPSNLNIISKLKEFGVNTMYEETKIDSNISGKTFVFTGALESLTRNRAQVLVEMKGGIFSNSVTKKTDYLVSGSKTGSKLDKARESGITVLSEDEFLKLIDEKDA